MTVLTAGTFDLPHAGHGKFFARCRALAGEDNVIVFVNSDEFVTRFKRRPVFTQKERMETIQHFRGVDMVLPNKGDEDLRKTFAQFFRGTAPFDEDGYIIAIGSDWLLKDYFQQTKLSEEWLRLHNCVLAFLPYNGDISSTQLRLRLQ